jgi:hypothetical protein
MRMTCRCPVWPQASIASSASVEIAWRAALVVAGRQVGAFA